MKQWWKRPTEIASADIVTRAIRTYKTENFDTMSWSEPFEWLTRDLQHEAQLTDTARDQVRTTLSDLIVGRASGGKTGVAERSIDDEVELPRSVLIAGADATAVATLARSYGATALNDPLRDEFCGLEWELDFHLPNFAEWLASANLAEQYESAARRSGYGSTNATIGTTSARLWCAYGHAEHLTQFRRAVPHGVIVALSGGSDQSTVETSVTRRGKFSDSVDPDKVARYWSWRVGLLREKFDAQLVGFRAAADPRLIEIDTEVALRDPVSLGTEIARLL